MILAFIMLFCSLALPPLASWTASQSPERTRSLLGIWFSLLSIFVTLFLWAPDFYLYFLAQGFPSGFHLVLLMPPLGFGLTFTLSLILALRLSRLHAHKRTNCLATRSEGLVSLHNEDSEHVSLSEGREIQPVSTGKNFHLPIFAFLGLLCHLLIFLSLSFPYIEYYDAYADNPQFIPTTGWQLLSEEFLPRSSSQSIVIMPPLWAPLAIALFAALIVPALIFLAYLLPWLVKSVQKSTRLRKSLSLSRFFIILGLGISSFWLLLSLLFRGGDLSDPYQYSTMAFAILPVAFLLSLICCRALMTSSQRHIEWLQHASPKT